jgi:hypothetical protein
MLSDIGVTVSIEVGQLDAIGLLEAIWLGLSE